MGDAFESLSVWRRGLVLARIPRRHPQRFGSGGPGHTSRPASGPADAHDQPARIPQNQRGASDPLSSISPAKSAGHTHLGLCRAPLPIT